MALNNEKQFIDRWLDAAMKEYGGVEADSALEHRVLQHLQAAPSPARSAQWQWRLVFATGAAIVLIVAGVIISKPHSDVQKTAQKATATPSTAPTVAAILTTSARPLTVVSKNAPRKVRHHAASEAKAQSWPAQFPTPYPLSPQEQLLARYVREQPRQAQFVARARAELLKETLAEFDARDHDKKISSSFE